MQYATVICAIFITILVVIIYERNWKRNNQSDSIEMLYIPKQIIDKTHRILFFDNRYFKYQMLKNGEWVLHNLNGPAVYDTKTHKSTFFINGIKYDDELQYLMAKEVYENDQNNI